MHVDYVGNEEDLDDEEVETMTAKPSMLVQIPEQLDNDQVEQRKDVIKDFSFPTGIRCRKL